MRKSLIATILFALIALAGTSGNAFAYSNSMTVPVAPGSRVCLTTPVSAQYQAHASGISDLGVRFSTHRSADGVTYRDLDQTADDSRGWNPYYRINMQPSYFPNFFKICARNLGAKSATVTLLIETDANVH